MQVGREPGVAIAARVRGRVGVPVSARVVGNRSQPGRGQTVEHSERAPPEVYGRRESVHEHNCARVVGTRDVDRNPDSVGGNVVGQLRQL